MTIRPKKVLLFPEIGRLKNFYHLPARIVESVSEYIFFVSNKKTFTDTKTKETKENRKTKETKEETEKENVVYTISVENLP